MTSIPPMNSILLCEHEASISKRKGYRQVCSICQSFWDLESVVLQAPYQFDYSLSRQHYDPAVGANKVASLKIWLKQLSLDISTKTVCEVGFGGGWTLKYFQQHAEVAYGIEILPANIDFAVSQGLPRAHLFNAAALPDLLPEKINLWVFQDSFEHIPDPTKFLKWMVANSEHASILIVAPRADSLSQKLMGRFWPHKLADHQFHWSHQGLVEFFEKRNFLFQKSFSPVKVVSLKTLLMHLRHKFNWPFLDQASALVLGKNLSISFNIGEMGLYFFSK